MDVGNKEVMAMASVYLAQHTAELIAEAKLVVDQWAREGRWGPRGGFRRS